MNHMIQVWQFDQVDDPYSRQCVIMMFIYYIYYCAPVWPHCWESFGFPRARMLQHIIQVAIFCL